MEIVRILLLAIMIGIGVFVVKRLEHKYRKGNLGKKKSKGDQNLLDSLIPLGMLSGFAIGVIFSCFYRPLYYLTISLGAGIGSLFGYFAFEFPVGKEPVIHKGFG